MPVGRETTEQDKDILRNNIWRDFEHQIREFFDYLGIPFGRLITEKDIFKKAVIRIRNAAARWKSVPLTLAAKFFTANIFIISYIGYATQVAMISEKLSKKNQKSH